MNPYYKTMNGDRQFLFPFLVGALTGGAAVGITRPRPIFHEASQYVPDATLYTQQDVKYFYH